MVRVGRLLRCDPPPFIHTCVYRDLHLADTLPVAARQFVGPAPSELSPAVQLPGLSEHASVAPADAQVPVPAKAP